MKIATILKNDVETAAIMVNETFFTIEVINEKYNKNWHHNLYDILRFGEFDSLKSWFNEEGKESLQNNVESDIDRNQIIFAPLYRHPHKIWGIGLNYKEHANDLLEEAPSSIPASFMKSDTTIIGHNDEIVIPRQSNKTTGEAELGVIIKKKCKDIEIKNWLDVVAGFTTIIDMTAEDILRKNPRYLTLSKNFDTFFSFGPLLITPDEFEDLKRINVSTVINGKVHAKNSISNMSFPPKFLVSFHSKVMTFLPGDIISTGTPRAVELHHGDIIECDIDRFIPLRNTVKDLKK